jgi:hypothetical protein
MTIPAHATPTLVTYPPTVQGVTDALDQLGDHPDRIAKELAARNIRGRIGDSSNCPIARYVHRVIPQAIHVTAGSVIEVYTWDQMAGMADELPFPVRSPAVHVQLFHLEPSTHEVSRVRPGPVALFIADFDHGAYPDLVDERWAQPVQLPEPVFCWQPT